MRSVDPAFYTTSDGYLRHLRDGGRGCSVKRSVDVMQVGYLGKTELSGGRLDRLPEGLDGQPVKPVHRTQVCEQSHGIHVLNVGMIRVGVQPEINGATPGVSIERPLVVDALEERLQRGWGKAQDSRDVVRRCPLLQEGDRLPLRGVEAWIKFMRHRGCLPSLSVPRGRRGAGGMGFSNTSRERCGVSRTHRLIRGVLH